MKKDVSQWRPVGLHERPGLTADDLEALAEMLSVPSGEARDIFCKRLAGIAMWHGLEDAWRDAPAPSDIRKKLESIRSAAHRLAAQFGVSPLPDEDVETLDALSHPIRSALISAAERYGETIDGYSDHPPTAWPMPSQSERYMDYHGDSKLGAAIEHIQLISAWCERAIQSQRQAEDGAAIERTKRHGETGRQARNPRNEPLNDLIGRLANLYRDTTGRKPGFSRTTRSQGKASGPFVRFVLAVCERMEIPMTATGFEKRWRVVAPLVRATPDIERVLEREEQLRLPKE